MVEAQEALTAAQKPGTSQVVPLLTREVDEVLMVQVVDQEHTDAVVAAARSTEAPLRTVLQVLQALSSSRTGSADDL